MKTRLSVVAALVLGLSVLLVPKLSRAVDAEENYAKHCVKCHGENGDGKGPASAVLDVSPGDFSDCETMKTLSDEFLVTIITTGGEAVGKSPQMPAARKVAAEDIPALVKYIRGFCE